MNPLWYTVHEDYNGEIAVSSFCGKTAREERRFALSGSKTVYLVTRDHDEAQRRAAALRNTIAPAKE